MRKITKDDVRIYITGDVCPEQIFLYLGNNCDGANRIGYIRLRFGVLTLTPIVDGHFDVSDVIYKKRFWFHDWKGMFKDFDERKKYVAKCIRKIVRWYNRKYKNTPEPL